MNLYGNDIGGKPYSIFSNYLKKCNINNFKVNKKFNYMTEHVGQRQINFGKLWYKYIMLTNLLTNKQINSILKINDSIGNPITYEINDNIIKCSPNTLKYIYFGLLNCIYIKKLNIKNFNFIEIGGGYGGQNVVLQKLFDIQNIKYNKYILIDLNNVIEFQKKYIIYNNLEKNCIFLNTQNYTNYINDQNINYLFSSYSLSELLKENRYNYYENLLKYINNGFIVWNNKIIDIPKENLIIEEENPKTGGYNKFIYF